MTMQNHINYVCTRFPDAYADKYAMFSWVIRSRLCGQIGLFASTEAEAWKNCYELLKIKQDKRDEKI